VVVLGTVVRGSVVVVVLGVGVTTEDEQFTPAKVATSHFASAVYKRRFTVPLGRFVRTLTDADPVIADATAAEEADGNILLKTAA
jgi:hypothetical protein